MSGTVDLVFGHDAEAGVWYTVSGGFPGLTAEADDVATLLEKVALYAQALSGRPWRVEATATGARLTPA